MQAPPIDPTHWLLRLSPADWMSAAVAEYEQAIASLRDRQQRRGVASARRAAGMGLNAVLVLAPDEAWGRSYVDHLKAVGADPAVPEGVRHATLQLLEAPLDGPRLVRLGSGDPAPAVAARLVLEWCADRLDALARSP